jgi:hypothetical protein
MSVLRFLLLLSFTQEAQCKGYRRRGAVRRHGPHGGQWANMLSSWPRRGSVRAIGESLRSGVAPGEGR